jgi:hypothetical protein
VVEFSDTAVALKLVSGEYQRMTFNPVVSRIIRVAVIVMMLLALGIGTLTALAQTPTPSPSPTETSTIYGIPCIPGIPIPGCPD